MLRDVSPDWEWLGPMVGRFGLAYGLATVALGFALGLALGSVGLALLALILLALIILVFVVHTITDEARGGPVTDAQSESSESDQQGGGVPFVPDVLWEGGPDDATRRQKLLFYALGLLATSAAALVLWGELGPGT